MSIDTEQLLDEQVALDHQELFALLLIPELLRECIAGVIDFQIKLKKSLYSTIHESQKIKLACWRMG